MEGERRAFGKPTGPAFMPLASDPVIQAETMKQLKIGESTQEELLDGKEEAKVVIQI